MSLWNGNPSLVKPMLAFPSKPFDSKDFLMEIKYDGTRCIAYIDKNSRTVKMLNRRMAFFEQRYPEFASLYKSINAKRAIIDGEVVVLEKGKPNFYLLEEREQSSSPARIDILKDIHPATYIVFDVLHVDGEDVMNLKLYERKKLLDKVVDESDFMIKSSFIYEKGKALFSRARRKGLEGVMAKRLDSIYVQERSKDWLKIKSLNTIDAIVLGYTSTEKEALSALILGAYKNGRLAYIGRAGTGFTEKQRSTLHSLLSKMKSSKPYAKIESAGAGRSVTYTKPEIVAEIKFLELTNDGMLRAPSFMRLRNDKLPSECTLESAVPFYH
ncbi:MAG: non-homologous end-joining DNA ligase [Candidatus Micrarchaeia archaeon]